jgi:hypothetical protein
MSAAKNLKGRANPSAGNAGNGRKAPVPARRQHGDDVPEEKHSRKALPI